VFSGRSGEALMKGLRLQCFPVILDQLVIQYDREAPYILVLAHVLVGEPDPTSPGHAPVCLS
jgi:hypothetical protein